MEDTPDEMLLGELRKLSMTLHNTSNVKVVMLRVAISHPAFMCIDDTVTNPEDPEADEKKSGLGVRGSDSGSGYGLQYEDPKANR